jgi:LacI family transcriptional regulator
MQKRATIKDLAQLMGVSVSTISRGLRDHPDISLDMREQIKRKAQELNYHPNHLAAGLRKRQSKIIGMIIPEITMFFFPSVIRGIEEECKAHGFQLLVLQSSDDLETEKRNVRICGDQSVDGLLMSLSNQTTDLEHLQEFKDLGIPVVLFDKSMDSSPFDEVLIDDEAVAYACVRYLIEQGCMRIAALLGSKNLSISQKRANGFHRAMEQLGNDLEEPMIIYAASYEEGRQEAQRLSDHFDPDGVFLMSDELIAAATRTLLHKSPQCKIIGISDGRLPDILQAPIAYVHHDGYQLGRMAAARLLERIQQTHAPIVVDDPPRRSYLEVKLNAGEG